MHPKMIPVLSSNIDGVQYLPDQTLLVTFKGSGKTYAYEKVPADVFSGMRHASSKGTYLNQVIKRGGYAFRVVTTGELDSLLRGASATARPETRRQVRPGLSAADLIERYPFLRLAF